MKTTLLVRKIMQRLMALSISMTCTSLSTVTLIALGAGCCSVYADTINLDTTTSIEPVDAQSDLTSGSGSAYNNTNSNNNDIVANMDVTIILSTLTSTMKTYYGTALANSGEIGTVSGIIKVESDTIDNSNYAHSYAVYNTGTIDAITAELSVSALSVTSSTDDLYASAIYNNGGIINSISGNVSASSYSDTIGINNQDSGTIGTISSKVTVNSNTVAYGIWNYSSSIGTISGDIDVTSSSSSNEIYGITNQGGNIDTISGNISATGNSTVRGINNNTSTNPSATSSIGSISGDISATSNSGQAIGIDNECSITSMSGTVTAQGATTAFGIYNDGSITELSGDVSSISGSSYSIALWNAGGTISTIDSNISATSNNSFSVGIYNSSSGTINSLSGSISVSGATGDSYGYSLGGGAFQSNSFGLYNSNTGSSDGFNIVWSDISFHASNTGTGDAYAIYLGTGYSIADSLGGSYSASADGTSATAVAVYQEGSNTLTFAQSDGDYISATAANNTNEAYAIKTSGDIIFNATDSRAKISITGKIDAGTTTISVENGDYSIDSESITASTLAVSGGGAVSFISALDASGVDMTANGGSISFSDAANTSLNSITTNNTSINLGDISNGGLTIKTASVITGGKLSTSLDVSAVESALSNNSTITLTIGSNVTIDGTTLIISQSDATSTFTIDMTGMIGTTDVALFEIVMDSTSTIDDIQFEGEAFEAYFENACIDANGIIYLNIIDPNAPSNYASLARSSNGAAGLNMVNTASQLDLSASPDLKQAITSLDTYLATGNSTAGDALGAAIAGSTLTSVGTAQMADIERQLRSMRQQYANANSPVGSYKIWLSAEGGNSEQDSQGSKAGHSFSNWGASVGANMRISEGWSAGLAFTAMNGDLSSKISSDYTEGDLDTQYFSMSASYKSKNWSHSVLLSMGLAQADLKRSVSYDGGNYQTKGKTDGLGMGISYELGYNIQLNEEASSTLQPIIQLKLIDSQMDGYTERGSDARLKVSDQDNCYASIGVGAAYTAQVGEELFNRKAMLAFRAMLVTDLGNRQSDADVSLISANGVTQTIKGNDVGPVGVELGVGFGVQAFAPTGQLFLNISCELRNDLNSINSTLGYSYSF